MRKFPTRKRTHRGMINKHSRHNNTSCIQAMKMISSTLLSTKNYFRALIRSHKIDSTQEATRQIVETDNILRLLIAEAPEGQALKTNVFTPQQTGIMRALLPEPHCRKRSAIQWITLVVCKSGLTKLQIRCII